jgi:hypothetical protein
MRNFDMNEVLMDEGIELLFKGEHSDFLSLRILGRASLWGKTYWDLIFLKVEFEAKVSVFRGKVSTLETLDKWIKIQVAAYGTGQISITGFVKNGVYDPNTLNFAITTDQTFLVEPMEQLKLVLEQFDLPNPAKR